MTLELQLKEALKLAETIEKSSPGKWEARTDRPGLEHITMIDKPYGDYLKQVLSDEDYPTKVDDINSIVSAHNDAPGVIRGLVELIRDLHY